MKLPDTEQLLPEEYVTIADPWRQEWERGVQVPVHEDTMHIPITRFCSQILHFIFVVAFLDQK